MVRRFVWLLVVAWVSGTVGVGLGLLYAPGAGSQTRAAVAAFLEQHETILADYYARGRDALDKTLDSVGTDDRPAPTP